MVKSLLNVYANCVGEHIPEIGDASLIGSGDTGGDGDKSDVPTSVSGDTAGEGIGALSSSKATGSFLCFRFFCFSFFSSVMFESCRECHRLFEKLAYVTQNIVSTEHFSLQ